MLTPEQEEARKKFLGSSDMSAIVGVDPFSNISDVYIEKTQDLLPACKDTMPADIGTIFENAVLQLFAKVRNVELRQDIFLTHDIFCSNLDGFIDADHEIVEAKTAGDPDGYGEQMTDEIPERHIIQVHEAMYVVSNATGCECKVAWVPVLLPGYKSLQFRIYKVTRRDSLMNDIVDLGKQFWTNHVEKLIPPQPYQPSLDIIKRIRRTPESIADLPDELVDEWKAATSLASEAKKLADEAKSRVLAAIGNCDAGETPTGRLVTYFEYNRAGYEVQPSTYRTPYLKVPKKAKTKITKRG